MLEKVTINGKYYNNKYTYFCGWFVFFEFCFVLFETSSSDVSLTDFKFVIILLPLTLKH